MKFKVGDRVRVVNTLIPPGWVPTNFLVGDILTLEFYSDSYPGGYWSVREKSGLGFYVREENIKLINQEKPMENIKEKFILALTSEPQKSFRKAGITNGDDLLTTDGQQIFLTWLLKKNQDEFKKEVVDELLKEEK